MCTGEKNNLIKRQNGAQTYLYLQSATALEAKSNFLITGEVIRRGRGEKGNYTQGTTSLESPCWGK